jgi:cGMP-dependent protein kinase
MGGTGSKKGSASSEPRPSVSVDPIQALFDNKKIEQFLRSVPVLSKLTAAEEEELVRALSIKRYKLGEVIIRQGDEGLGFYIIAKGEVIVTREDKGVHSELGRLKGGDFFGEAALSAPGAKRGASVTSNSPSLITLYLDRTSFESMFKKKDATVRFAKRKAVTGGGGGMKAISKPPAGATKTKTQAQIDEITNSVSSNLLFQSLELSHRAAVIQEMYSTEVKAGTTVITQGDLGDNFYVIEEGSFDIYVNEKKVVTFAKGKCFGELALMYNSKRAATVTAAEDSKVWVVDRYTYRRVVSQVSEEEFNTSVGFLNSVELLQPLAQYERVKIAEALEERRLNEGEWLFKQGEVGDSMYIIHTGSVRIIHDNATTGQSEVLADIGRGAFFGERSLMKNEPRFAGVVATSDSILLRLDQAAFNLLLGPLEDILMTKVESYHPPKETKTSIKSDSYDMADMKVIGTLGKGSFGHVQLVQSKLTQKTFALKAVSKQQIVNTGQQNHIMSEKKTMERMNHPFLIKLYATFKDRDRLYFLLEPSLGGELFSVLREKTLFDEDTARFFAACVVSAFEYMHDMDIIYRDLKPENLLLDEKGYLKITDFGFAKDISQKGRTFTLCGTPDYLAPEIVAGRGHAKGVDWWTLGVFIYEMLASYPPFFDEDPMQTYARIMTGHITFPSHFSKEAVSLIKKLLHHKPTKRLGVVKGGAKLIKKHPWFKGLDWDALYNRQIGAPFIPEIKSSTDLENFDEYPEDEEDEIEPYQEVDEDGPPWDADF